MSSSRIYWFIHYFRRLFKRKERGVPDYCLESANTPQAVDFIAVSPPRLPITRKTSVNGLLLRARLGKMRAKNRLLWALIGSLLLPSGVFAQQSQVWQPSLEAARRAAGQTNRLVLVFFCADWCQPCREMERDVFGQPNAVADLQANYVLAKVNVNHFPATAKEYGITGVPTTVVITPQGQAVATVPNRMAATQYVAKLSQVAAGAKQSAVAAVAQTAPPAMPQVPPPAVPAKTDDRYADRYADRGAARAPESPTDRYAERPAERSADRYAALDPRPSSPVTGPQFPGLPAPADNPDTPPGPAPEARVIPPPKLPGPPTTPATPPAVPASPDPRIPASPAPVGSALPGSPVAPAIPPAAPPAIPPAVPPAMPPSSPAVPATPSTPTATAGFGLDGYCPVCLVDQRKWVAGNRQFGIEHRGRVYLFERTEERDRFWADPDLYTPILSGNDLVIALERGESVPGRREFGVFYGNRIYLFADKTSLEKFWKNPNQYANQALQAMRSAGPVNPRPPLR
jgi:thioredoxin-related protein/YHS domain-containing protein